MGGVAGSSPAVRTMAMDKERMKKIETQKPEEIWEKFHDQDSEEDLIHVFGEVLRKVMNEPNLFYVKHINDSVVVIRRADQKTIYETGDPAEIDALLEIGVEK